MKVTLPLLLCIGLFLPACGLAGGHVVWGRTGQYRTEQGGAVGKPATPSSKSSGALTGNKVSLTAQDSGKTVMLRKGGTLSILLESNPSTGYSWQADKLPAGLKELKPVMTSEPDAPPGAPSMLTLSYRAEKPVNGSLTLTYAQHWDPKVPPAKTFTVHIKSK